MKEHVDMQISRVNVKDHVDKWISRVNVKSHVNMQISIVNVKNHMDMRISSHFFPYEKFPESLRPVDSARRK